MGTDLIQSEIWRLLFSILCCACFLMKNSDCEKCPLWCLRLWWANKIFFKVYLRIVLFYSCICVRWNAFWLENLEHETKPHSSATYMCEGLYVRDWVIQLVTGLDSSTWSSPLFTIEKYRIDEYDSWGNSSWYSLIYIVISCLLQLLHIWNLEICQSLVHCSLKDTFNQFACLWSLFGFNAAGSPESHLSLKYQTGEICLCFHF